MYLSQYFKLFIQICSTRDQKSVFLPDCDVVSAAELCVDLLNSCVAITAPCDDEDNQSWCPRACDVCADPPFGEGDEQSEISH